MALGRLVLLLCVLGLFPLSAVHAQSDDLATVQIPDDVLNSALLDDWDKTLDDADTYVSLGVFSDTEIAEIRLSLLGIVDRSAELQVATQQVLETIENRLDAFGPPPEEGDEEEDPTIASERAELQRQLRSLRSQIALAEIAQARANELQTALDVVQRNQFLESVFKQFPLPYNPAVLFDGLSRMVEVAADIAATPKQFWQSVPDETMAYQNLAGFLFTLVFVLLVALVVRRFLLRRFGIDPTIEDPSYTRRILAAIAEGVARGVIPSALLLAVIYRANTTVVLVSEPFAEILSAFAVMLIVYVLALELPKAALSPNNPGWGLTRLTKVSSQRLLQYLRPLVILYVLRDFGAAAAFIAAPNLINDNLTSVYVTITAVPLAIFILLLLRPSVWQRDADGEGEEAGSAAAVASQPDDDQEDEAPSSRSRFLRFCRFVLILFALTAMLAPAVGYVAVSDYLISNILSTGLIGGLSYIVRGLLRELIALMLSSGFVRDTLAWEHSLRLRIKFWLRSVMDVIIAVLVLLSILPAWGLPTEIVLRWVRSFFTGFDIGGVRLAPAEILFGFAIFFVILGVVRAIKFGVGTRMLPQTGMDPGLQNSITTGIGYIGFVAAAMIAVLTMGVDLSGIAIVAGALSVGIGFGLQNIVNNFVSGLILLIERPIKVGDWVVVGSMEGTVKQINVRSTEIETFQRASVIIPNADIISSSVTNWTHKDRYGRVEVPIGVAYGTDTKKVEQTLLEVARNHDRVMRYPGPFVVFKDFGASSLDFELRAYTNDVLWKVIIASDMRHTINERFAEEGIEIPFPQRVVHMAPPVMESKPPKEEPPLDPSETPDAPPDTKPSSN